MLDGFIKKPNLSSTVLAKIGMKICLEILVSAGKGSTEETIFGNKVWPGVCGMLVVWQGPSEVQRLGPRDWEASCGAVNAKTMRRGFCWVVSARSVMEEKVGRKTR